MHARSFLESRRRKLLFGVLVVVGFALMFQRLRAEYCYVGVILSEGEIDWFYKLQGLGPAATPVLKRLLRHEDYVNR
ncbi:MAG: hypothetical protein ACE5H0_14480, partial [Bacteroidota bacterium]